MKTKDVKTLNVPIEWCWVTKAEAIQILSVSERFFEKEVAPYITPYLLTKKCYHYYYNDIKKFMKSKKAENIEDINRIEKAERAKRLQRTKDCVQATA